MRTLRPLFAAAAVTAVLAGAPAATAQLVPDPIAGQPSTSAGYVGYVGYAGCSAPPCPQAMAAAPATGPQAAAGPVASVSVGGAAATEDSPADPLLTSWDVVGLSVMTSFAAVSIGYLLRRRSRALPHP